VSSPDWKIDVLADQQGNCARSRRAVKVKEDTVYHTIVKSRYTIYIYQLVKQVLPDHLECSIIESLLNLEWAETEIINISACPPRYN
jgi:hypothetical protein